MHQGRYASLTHRGRRRRTNQDTVFAEQLESGSLLIAVADGMGGAQGGEVASSEAIRVLADQLRASSLDEPADALQTAYAEVNGQLHQQSATKPELHGMGTTMVAAVVQGGQAWLANVGDSRAYMVRASRIRQITEDHSLVAEQVRSGYLTKEEAQRSEQRNIITRSLGPDQTVGVDMFGPVQLSGQAALVLCSDGLHGVVDDQEILEVVSSSTPKEAAKRLVALANSRGGPDNISVVIYQSAVGVDDTVLLKQPAFTYFVQHRILLGATAAIATILVLAVGGFFIARDGFGGGSPDGSAGIGASPSPTSQGSVDDIVVMPPTSTSTVAQPTSSATATPVPTPDVTVTPSPSPTETPTRTRTLTHTPAAPTETPTPAHTPTVTPTLRPP